jgi:DNA helicase HerA-like ATPase
VNEIVSIGSCAVVQVSAKDYLVQVDERQLAGTHSDRFVTGSGRVLGRLDGTTLTKAFPVAFAGEPFRIAAEQETGLIGSPESTSALLQIGTLDGTSSSAFLIAKGLSRHTFLCGQSGSGKTYSLGALLEQVLIETTLPMVLVDPNSDHVHLGELRSTADLNRGRERPLSKRDEAALRRRHGEAGRVVVARRGTGADMPLQIHLSDLTIAEQALTLGLDPIADSDEYSAFIDAIHSLGGVRYGIAAVEAVLRARLDEPSRRLAQRIVNLGVGGWGVWAPEGGASLVDIGTDWRVVVLDTGSLEHAHEREVVSLGLLGLMRRREQRRSVLIVMDEAHNICPPDAATELGRAVTELAVWIAGEGRKFGIHLLLATQRPQKVHPNVVSQCDNLLLMRVNSTDDLRQLETVFSHVPAPMIAEASSFGLGEMLAAGPVTPTPLRLRMGSRLTPEGGADLPTDWARPQ